MSSCVVSVSQSNEHTFSKEQRHSIVLAEGLGVQGDAHFRAGLVKAVLPRDGEGNVIRTAGIMGVVVSGGTVCVYDRIEVELPAEPHHPLERV